MSLSHDYETESRLREVLNDTCSKVEQLMSTGFSLLESLKRFEDDQAVRILTVHKSKGLEFDSVVLLGVENESYWGNPDENLCTFFVGVSRAKRRLLLTHVGFRSRPADHYGRWNTHRSKQERFLGCVI